MKNFPCTGKSFSDHSLRTSDHWPLSPLLFDNYSQKERIIANPSLFQATVVSSHDFFHHWTRKVHECLQYPCQFIKMGSKSTSAGTHSLADSGFGSGESCSTTPSLSRISQGGSEGLSQDLIQGLKLEILGLTKLVKSLQLEMQELKEDRRCQPICQCILTNPSEVPLIKHKERPSL